MPPKKMKKYEWKDSKFFQTEEQRRAPRVIPMVYFIYDKDQTGEAGRLLRVEVHISGWDCKCYDHRWWGDETMKDNRVLVPDTDLVMEAYEFNDGTPAQMEKEAFEFVKNWWKSQ